MKSLENVYTNKETNCLFCNSIKDTRDVLLLLPPRYIAEILLKVALKNISLNNHISFLYKKSN